MTKMYAQFIQGATQKHLPLSRAQLLQQAREGYDTYLDQLNYCH